MKKTVLLLAALFVGQASADRTPENLKGLKPQDFCTIRQISVQIDGKNNSELVSSINMVLDEQNLRAGYIFRGVGEKGCLATGSLFVDATKSSKGGYIYTVSYSISPEFLKATAFGNKDGFSALSKPVSIGYVSIWDVSGYGAASNDADLEKTLQKFASDAFQKFAADWNRTH